MLDTETIVIIVLFAIIILLLIFAIVGTPRNCANHQHCPQGTVCTGGKCLSFFCDGNLDCPIGSGCINGKCIHRT